MDNSDSILEDPFVEDSTTEHDEAEKREERDGLEAQEVKLARFGDRGKS